MDIKEIQAGIARDVAARVIAELPDEAKELIVAEAMKAGITSYDFERAIEARLVVEANLRLDKLLKDTKFDKLLCEKFQAGVDLFMQTLPKAVAAAMVGTLVGPREYKSGAVYRGMCDVLGIGRNG